MFGVIKRNPALRATDLWRAAAWAARPAARTGEKQCSYTGYSRYGLYNILRLLELPPGSRVLLPAYICDVVLLPLKALGLEPVYYGVSHDFQIDFSTVSVAPRTRALITVNYFGLSQNFPAIESFAHGHDLVWINDNSHGFASRDGPRSLESFGDFSVTSFRKSIPAVNGAKVRINSDAYAGLCGELSRLNAIGAVEGKMLRFAAATALAKLRWRPWRHPDYADIFAFSEDDDMRFRIDRLASAIVGGMDEDWVQRRRYTLYRAVEDFLDAANYPYIERFARVLRPGNSPLVFPISVADSERWHAVLRVSRRGGVDIHTWPSMPRDVIENDTFESATRWRRLLFLPIHQDLEPASYCRRLAYIFDAAA